MNIHRIVDMFWIIYFAFYVALVSPTVQREKNVALNALVREILNDEAILDNIVDGNITTCTTADKGKGLHIKLNDTYVINKIVLLRSKSLTNADSVWFGRGEVTTRCAIGKENVKVIRCFQGQIEADALEIRHKFSRKKEWCEIQVISCEDGFFGDECSEDCHCDGSEVCHKVTGACQGGLCAAGWEGESCQSACTNDMFGKNCVGKCHCGVGVECNIRNGSCLGSICDQGWYGSTCQTGMPSIKTVSLYTESENSLDISFHSWGNLMDEELSFKYLVLFRRSRGADSAADRQKRKDEYQEEVDADDDDVIGHYLKDKWKRGPEVDHVRGRHNYIKTVDSLQHNTFYEFMVLPMLTLQDGKVIYGEAHKSLPFRTKCKAPENPVMRNVTSFVDQSYTPSRAAISVFWKKLSDYESNCENILYYEIYYEDASKPMPERQWLKKTVHPINDDVNISGVHFDTDYRVKMCVLNNYHLETCCDPIKLKTHEPPTPKFNYHSSAANQQTGLMVGVLFLVLVIVVVVAGLLLYRQRYSRDNKKYSESFFTRNESQVGLATDLSHSSEHEDLLSQIIIRSSLNNNNNYQGHDLSSHKVKQLERTFMVPVQKSAEEMKRLSHPIRREEFLMFMEEAKKGKYLILRREYEEIPSENPEATKTVGQMKCNIMKNRFKDVIAYDHTRVLLMNEGGKEGGGGTNANNGDYINANYIDGYNKQRAYIATQGCKKTTVLDFWRMIWQEDVRRVVMVTNLIERSSIKCQQYWPDRVGSSCCYGEISVLLSDVIKTTQYTIRSLEVKKGDEAKRHIKQFHFTAWPDQGVPSKINQMLTFRNKVRSCDLTNPGIIVVHCSAGIGRTGAFVGLDISMDQLQGESQVDVLRTTATMRMHRCNLIQRVEQYVFLYRALAEYLRVGNTAVSSSKFNSYYEDLRKVTRSKGDDSGAKNKLQLQFELLESLTSESSSSSSNVDESHSALLPQNKDKNRYSAVLPNDRSRPYLTSVIEGTNDYINALYLDGHHSKNAYIITQMPLNCTVIDFWRLIFEHDVRIIIMLNSFHPLKNQSYGQYWPEENEESECGPFLVQSVKTRRKGNIIIKELELTCVDEVQMNSSLKSRYDSSPHQVMVFHMSSLDHDYFLCPYSKQKLSSSQLNEFTTKVAEDVSQLIELVDHEISNVDVDLPTVVHCDDGFTLSGLFVAISCIHERLKVEGEVDVFQTVRNIKSSQAAIITSPKQYQFCYEMASKFVNK